MTVFVVVVSLHLSLVTKYNEKRLNLGFLT